MKDIFDATLEASDASPAVFYCFDPKAHGAAVECTLNNYDIEGNDDALQFTVAGGDARSNWREAYRASRALLAGRTVIWPDAVVRDGGGKWDIMERTDGAA